MRFISFTSLLVCLLTSHAFAQEAKTIDQQYQDVAKSRTDAELALRNCRVLFEEADNRWRTGWANIEMYRTTAVQALDMAAQDEQRKPEDIRSQPVLEDLQQRRRQIDIDWARFTQIDRPAIDGRFQSARQIITGPVSQVYNFITQWEPNWKAAEVDIGALQAAYEAVTQRANGVKAQAQKALDELEKAEKMWQGVSVAATQPAAQGK